MSGKDYFLCIYVVLLLGKILHSVFLNKDQNKTVFIFCMNTNTSCYEDLYLARLYISFGRE